MDAVEAERLRMERDDLLRAIEELRTGIDLARQEAEVTWQCDEVCKLWSDVDDKSSVSLPVFLPRIRGKPFDMIDT